MRTIRIAAPAAVMAVAAIGLAAPAAAELTDGTYQVTWDNGGTTTWVLTSCGEGCKSDGHGEYRLQGNTWTKLTPSGGTAYTIDDATLAGTVGMVGGEITGTYQLVKVG